MSSLLAWALLCALDGGVLTLSPEDQEVVDQLELLQELDSVADLDLLRELGVER